ncbi:MAG TPA: hypothetical protein VFU20_03900 [Sphingomicrobium sp.]|nr:hypothetical protein [Sphingomicrobium sp.]
MSAAARSGILLALALAACNGAPRDSETDNAAVTDVEALPPDESAATPTDQLANGATEPPNADNARY